ncbi:MAG: DNA cytosine methyltransferase [Akkermansiaceae bacterium]|nr:DNA cytosine methyltransferase [Akkermansiaceae bacterium]
MLLETEKQLNLINLNTAPVEARTSDLAAGELPIFSFFTGAGFLDFGFEKSGFCTLSANEVHLPFMHAYEHGRDKLKSKGTSSNFVCSIDEFVSGSQKLPRMPKDGLPLGFIGGPPCPDFSVAGKQKGKSGDNGKLTGSYARLICEQSPDWFMFENVKGLWRTKKHRAFYDEICKLFIENGYCLTNRLINSIEYGVPQDRDRIILIGFKPGLIGQRKAGFLPDGEFPWDHGVKYSSADIFSRPWPQRSPYQSDPLPSPNCPIELTVEHWFRKNKVTEHPNAHHGFVARAALKKFKTIDEGDDSGKSCKRLHRWRYSPTAAYGNNEVHIHPYKPRRISAAEALALQSLPKQYSLPPEMTLSNMFKTIGNGVPFLAGKGLASAIQTYIKRHN